MPIVMPFTYKNWSLYTREVILKGGKKQRIYFFSKSIPNSGTPCEMPENYKILLPKTKGSGMPYLTKK